MLDKLLSAGWYVMTNGTLFFVFFSFNTTCFAKTMVNARIVVTPLFQIIFQFPKPFIFVVCSLENPNDPDLVQAFLKKWWVESEKKTNTSVPFVITYHPVLSNLSNIVRKHWTTIHKHP
jgi:hypothetical protein